MEKINRIVSTGSSMWVYLPQRKINHLFTAELGDYSISDHKRGYVSEFRFIPHQDESFEHEVSRLHSLYRLITCRNLCGIYSEVFSGLIPSTAEMQYLKKCKMFDLYGLDLNHVRDDQKVPHQIGVSPRGVEIFKNKRRITIFYWSFLVLVEFLFTSFFSGLNLKVSIIRKNVWSLKSRANRNIN